MQVFSRSSRLFASTFRSLSLNSNGTSCLVRRFGGSRSLFGGLKSSSIILQPTLSAPWLNTSQRHVYVSVSADKMTEYLFDLYKALFKSDTKEMTLQAELKYGDVRVKHKVPIKDGEETPYTSLYNKVRSTVVKEGDFTMYVEDKGKRYLILDDEMLVENLKSCTGLDGTHPIIFVKKEEVPINQLDTEIEAYDYITQRSYTEELSPNQIKEYNTEINKVTLGNFRLKPVAWGGNDIHESELDERLLVIAKNYGWSESLQACIPAVRSMASQCFADVHVEFVNKQFVVSYVRFASWRSPTKGPSEEPMYCVRIATCKFTYQIPDEEMTKKWKEYIPFLGNNGETIQREYLEKIHAVMEDEAQRYARTQIMNPHKKLARLQKMT